MSEPEESKPFFKITLTTVGKLLETISDDCFIFENQPYSKLLVWEDFSTLLSKFENAAFFDNLLTKQKFLDLKKHSGFSLEKKTVNDNQYLVLVYSSANFKHASSNAQLREKFVLLRSFFEMPSQETMEVGSQKMSLENFYERLRIAHEKDDFTNIPQDVQHQSLRPVLRPYQVCSDSLYSLSNIQLFMVLGERNHLDAAT